MNYVVTIHKTNLSSICLYNVCLKFCTYVGTIFILLITFAVAPLYSFLMTSKSSITFEFEEANSTIFHVYINNYFGDCCECGSSGRYNCIFQLVQWCTPHSTQLWVTQWCTPLDCVVLTMSWNVCFLD